MFAKDNSLTKEERFEYWEMVMEDLHDSGLTKTAYCQKNEIAVSTLNYWENRIKEIRQAKELDGSRFVELPIPDGIDRTIRLTPAPETSFIPELSLSFSGIHVLVNSQTPMPLLSAVLEEIGYVK